MSFNKVFQILYSIYINRGNAKQELNDLKGSIDDYNLAIKVDLSPSKTIQRLAKLRGLPLPNHALAYFNRGNSYTLLEDYKAAFEDCSKAIELTPNMLFIGTKAELYKKLGLYREAIKYFNIVLELQPNSEDVITQIRECCTELGIDETQVKYHSTRDNESTELINRFHKTLSIATAEYTPRNINIPSIINKRLEK